MTTRFRITPLVLGSVAAAGLVAGLTNAAPSASSTPATVGRKAPAFQLMDQDGKPFRLGDHLGRRPLALVFYRGSW